MSFTHHQARKRFGQHWLVDERVLNRIVSAAELSPQDRVLEVGPGRGALTERLISSPALAVAAVELDRDLIEGLRKRFGADPRFSLIEGDVLDVELPAATIVVANIPYNITGPLLERLVGRLDQPLPIPFRRLVLMLQKEVAERICCQPGSRSYSALSVRMQLLAQTRSICEVPSGCFQPPPRVESEVIALDPLPAAQRIDPVLARGVETLLRRCFASRRKMLRNTLSGLAEPATLEQLCDQVGIRLDQRPQELAPSSWVRLVEGLNQSGGGLGSAAG